MYSQTDSILSFGRPQSEVKFIRFLFKYGYIGIGCVLVLILTDDSIIRNFDSWPFVVIFIAAVVGAHISLTKFIQRLDVNTHEKKLFFHIYLRDKIVEVNFKDIKIVNVGFYVKFTFNEGVVRFNEARNKELLKILENNFIIVRSPISNFLNFFEK